MARSCSGVLTLGVLVYRSVKAVDTGSVDAAGLPVFRAEVTTSTASMPDPAVIPPQARKALDGCRREDGPFGSVYFVRGEDAQAALSMPEAKPAKPAK